MDINTNEEDNRAIRYDYDFLENRTNDSDVLKIIWWSQKKLNYSRKEDELETIDNDKQLIWLVRIVWFSCYSIFIWFY